MTSYDLNALAYCCILKVKFLTLKIFHISIFTSLNLNPQTYGDSPLSELLLGHEQA